MYYYIYPISMHVGMVIRGWINVLVPISGTLNIHSGLNDIISHSWQIKQKILLIHAIYHIYIVRVFWIYFNLSFCQSLQYSCWPMVWSLVKSGKCLKFLNINLTQLFINWSVWDMLEYCSLHTFPGCTQTDSQQLLSFKALTCIAINNSWYCFPPYLPPTWSCQSPNNTTIVLWQNFTTMTTLQSHCYLINIFVP